MRIVDRAVTYPSRCAVLPYIGADHAAGYVDTSSELSNGGDGRWDFHVYVSVVAVREMAGLIGWVDPTELQERVVALEEENARLRADNAESQRVLDAIDVMESKDFQRRRKPGRPAKVEVS